VTDSRELQPINGTLAPAGVPIDALTQLVVAWLLSVDSPNTRRGYRRDLEQWAAWLTEHDTQLLTASRAHVDAWTETLKRDGKAKKTIARKISTLSSFYSYTSYSAEEYGLTIDKDPTARARRPKVDRDHSETPSTTADKARAIIAAAEADGVRTAAIIRLMLEDGFRGSDVRNARIEDLGQDRGHRTLTVTRKGGKRQRVPLPAGVAHAVDRAVGDRTEGFIIATKTGKPMAASEVYRTVRRICKKVGVDASPHGLRHTFATIALDARVPLRDVQDTMGHADPRTTRAYDRSRESLDRSASYAVAALLAVDADSPEDLAKETTTDD
jgi:site-specific recombinase XerD